ncbi:hypothetical protein LDENG_00213810 [Lucifuga dentata]|nr:hypothetical protein LDENG_00213810 [Lucifuga dentata]
MDKFLKENTTKQKFGHYTEPYSLSCGSRQQANKPKSGTRQYDDEYLKFGFTYTADPHSGSAPLPLRLVCGEKLSNEAMVSSKLKHHIQTKHPALVNKDKNYFEHLKDQNEKQAHMMRWCTKVSEKALEASYRLATSLASR